MKLYVSGDKRTVFRGKHNKSKTLLTLKMIRPDDFPPKYLQAHGAIGKESILSIDIATELASGDDKYGGRLADGRAFARSFDDEFGVHCLAFDLEDPSGDESDSFGDAT